MAPTLPQRPSRSRGGADAGGAAVGQTAQLTRISLRVDDRGRAASPAGKATVPPVTLKLQAAPAKPVAASGTDPMMRSSPRIRIAASAVAAATLPTKGGASPTRSPGGSTGGSTRSPSGATESGLSPLRVALPVAVKAEDAGNRRRPSRTSTLEEPSAAAAVNGKAYHPSTPAAGGRAPESVIGSSAGRGGAAAKVSPSIKVSLPRSTASTAAAAAAMDVEKASPSPPPPPPPQLVPYVEPNDEELEPAEAIIRGQLREYLDGFDRSNEPLGMDEAHILGALSSRLPPYTMAPDEVTAFPQYLPVEARYCEHRNRILALWFEHPDRWMTLDEVSLSSYSTRGGFVCECPDRFSCA